MKQKRKIEEIPDCYHQSMGWGNLHYPLVENIAERADILSTGRLARGMIGMRHAIRGAHKVPFGLPSLLHCDPETWPDDRDNTGIHALLMPLDKPTVPAFIHTKEELDGHGPMHWVGCNGDWVAFVQQDGHLTIRNIYISDTIIPLPSLQDAGISLGPTSEWWHGSPPFLFKYKIDKSLELLKVRIVKRPYKDDLAGPWHYEVIVVFDELIAILQAPLEKEWNILRNPEFFDRNSYVDAMGIPGYGTHAAPRLIDAPVIEDEEAEVAAIFAQIEGDAVMEDDEANVAQGDGGADEDNDADEEELEEEELEEDEFDDEELDDEELDDDGDNHNYEDEDVFLGFSDQRTWFLAPMRAESITGESDLAWIQVKGYRPILGPPILHMGNKLRSYPLMEPVNTKFYQLGNGGSLIFEHDLNALSDHLGRPHPEFHGAQIANQPGGELQWIITADLRGKMEPPTSERILFSFMESNWLDGLARALQEGLARLCGMSGEALKHPRFSHLARRNSAGEPMDMQPHPELKHHVDHLDFMLYHTQQDLDNARSYANQTHLALTEHADAIKMLSKDRKTLRRQKAKKDATIARLRAKIASLEATVKAQEDQLKEMEEDGEDIQGGSDFLSDDNDFEDDENTEGEDYDFLDDGEDDHTPLDVDDDEEE
ncbi:hypothetical protein QYE76_012707 [Lolium multiflorum]|uniref:Uncharacterized protein n=1 Tax=Lolium multiflorum TaxID=4521 RepID=A0AAD8TXL7_LOLMU|nr:hypothetical protein QYE76_012707 [Lolium multiflorum]